MLAVVLAVEVEIEVVVVSEPVELAEQMLDMAVRARIEVQGASEFRRLAYLARDSLPEGQSR